jgi:hypothetical protein
MYICIYIYVRIYIHTYRHTYTYILTYIHTYTYIHAYTYIFVYIYGYLLCQGHGSFGEAVLEVRAHPRMLQALAAREAQRNVYLHTLVA